MDDFYDRLADLYLEEMKHRLAFEEACDLLSQVGAAADRYHRIERRLTPEQWMRWQFAFCKAVMAITELEAAFGF
jgi:hypothetical protein